MCFMFHGGSVNNQRVFVVTENTRTQSLRVVQESFRERYPDRPPPARSTILRNVRKYQEAGTSLNLNKGNSGRRRTGRFEENVKRVRTRLVENPRDTSARRNGIGPQATFNRITRLDLRWHPYQMRVRHKLLPGDMP
ncbi:unnamed protein product [Owenia fusiformis]|uniref:DUF4817 domain-containing protein n=1 Tax=Owenia fusiformis TaxID=6347 RepID=A0A8S4P3N9_OWEFU|nr:unnamed protein product [Owenia fusiformis]